MIVIADTSPICYLILIGQIDLLPRLYGKVMIPTVVRDELAAAASPTMIRTWISQPPTWLEVVDVENIVLKGLKDLDAGNARRLPWQSSGMRIC
jgi:predicted nucleic acid-binding protein